MDEHLSIISFKFGDKYTSDTIIHLRNEQGRPELVYSHASVLKSQSKFFAERLTNQSSHPCIEIQCSEFDYDHYLALLKRLYLPIDLVLDTWDSVASTLSVLRVATTLQCESVINSCIQYLEAMPWENSEEEEIVRVVEQLGPIAMPILSRIQPPDFSSLKSVFTSAIRFATSTDGPFPPLGNELKMSAQEQVDYMLEDDEDIPLIASDNEIKAEIKSCQSNIFSLFERELSLILESDVSCMAVESKVMHCLSDLGWMCRILLKMGLMDEFVSKWVEISSNVLSIIEDKRLECIMWGVKLKLMEVTAQVLDAVGYGNVILPSLLRVHLIKLWLPFVRKLKPALDSMVGKDTEFPHKLDEDTCQSIEGSMVSLILSLPSDDQADILSDWMNTDHLRYPDLSEAFEVWSFRTKSAKRRLAASVGRIGNATATL